MTLIFLTVFENLAFERGGDELGWPGGGPPWQEAV